MNILNWNHYLAKMNIRFDRPKLILTDITCMYQFFSGSKWTFEFFAMHWQDNMSKPGNNMRHLILLTFYDFDSADICCLESFWGPMKKNFVYICLLEVSLNVHIYPCLLDVVFTVWVFVPVGIPYRFRCYPDNETGSYIHHAIHETWYDGHWSREHCSGQLGSQ